MYTYVALAQAAKEGVRYAIVHGSNSSSPSTTGSTDAVKAVVQKYANVCSACITVTYTADPGTTNDNDPPNRVRIVVTSSFSSLFSGWTPSTVRAAAEGRIFY
jgi:acetylornithine deacetylase/succinyl-diaminopimelate desuccinylase-like protein